MRTTLAELHGRRFDVAVIGAGINGAAAAQELAAAGYRVVLLDKADYGAGSSSRSTRLVHCGLRYLAPGGSPYEFLWNPGRLLTALKMTRKAMAARAEFVTVAPARARKLTLGFPVWDDMPVRPWHVDLALRTVEALGPRQVPLERRLFRRSELGSVPLFSQVRDQHKLLAVNAFSEYQFNWPERVLMDMVLDAERMGAVCRNYSPVTALSRGSEDSWLLTVTDARGEEGNAILEASLVLNTAGIWIDQVSKLGSMQPKRRILGTKGAHIVFKLPPEYADQGVISFNRNMDEPIYLVPWRSGLHYMGVTETVYEDDIDDIRASADDVEWLLGEFNHLCPGLAIDRNQILSTWAGVRPLTHDPAQPKGARSREIHDLTSDGMPNVLAVTAGPLTTHRSAGKELCAAVAARIDGSGQRQIPDYGARPIGLDSSSPALLNHYDGVRVADVVRVASTEHVVSLTDLMTRRLGLVWTETCGREGARRAAEEVAKTLGWDERRTADEITDFLAYLERYHAVPEQQLSPP